jgi:hypothetical protein
MRRCVVLVVAGVTLGVSCSNGTSTAPFPQETCCAPARSTTSTLPPDDSFDLAVRSYVRLRQRGDENGAWAMVSARCQDALGKAAYTAMVRTSSRLYSTARLVSVEVATAGPTDPRASYTFDQSALDQRDEQWVVTDVGWFWDGC